MFQVVRGPFYHEYGHDLNNFEIVVYNTYEEAVLASLTLAQKFVNKDHSDSYNEVVQISNTQIENDRLLKDKMYFSYGACASEYHIKITKID